MGSLELCGLADREFRSAAEVYFPPGADPCIGRSAAAILRLPELVDRSAVELIPAIHAHSGGPHLPAERTSSKKQALRDKL